MCQVLAISHKRLTTILQNPLYTGDFVNCRPTGTSSPTLGTSARADVDIAWYTELVQSVEHEPECFEVP